jgi:hypothetical protein
VYAISVTGTAGSGKSLLTSKLKEWYANNNACAVALYLDLGAVNLPYEPTIDARDHIDIDTIMESYGLGSTSNLSCESKTVLFVLDVMLVSSPANFVSIALLATSIRLRLHLPQVNVLSNIGMMKEKNRVLAWSSNIALLEQAISSEVQGESYLLSMQLLKGMMKEGFSTGLLAVSGATSEGMINLAAVLSRILKMGEEVEDLCLK